jgi:cellulose synthase/poly-beta-1,6-N-acetylglucosamine synthase-like glycosyltransferase
MFELLISILKILLLAITGSFIIWPLLTKFRMKHSYDENFKPLISVVIPAYNEEENIERCLKSVLSSKYERLEIIVVNDGSDDRTREIVENKFSEVKLISVPRSGRSRAVNVGIESAKGEIILLTDADCVMKDDWGPKLVRHFSDPRVGAVTGPTLSLSHSGNILEKIQNLYNYVIFHFFKYCMDSVGGLIALSGACTALRKSALASGKYDESLSSFENIDLTLKIVKSGYEVRFEPDAPVRSVEPKRFEVFLSRHYRWFSNLHKIVIRHSDLLLKPSYGAYSLTFTLLVIQTMGLFLTASTYIMLVLLANLTNLQTPAELSFMLIPYLLFTAIFATITVVALRKVNELTPQNILLSLLWGQIALYYALVILTSIILHAFGVTKVTYMPARD